MADNVSGKRRSYHFISVSTHDAEKMVVGQFELNNCEID